jgi:predicted membrane protein
MKRRQITIGVILILLGVFSLLNQLLPNVRLGRFVGPLILVGLGLLMILRPRMAGPGVKVRIPILGDIRNTGVWEVTRHEFWWFVGTNRLDFSEARFPEGDGTVRIIGLVNDIRITLPDDVGLSVVSNALVTEYSGLFGKQEKLINPVKDQTPNYETADKRVQVESFALVSEIKVLPNMV